MINVIGNLFGPSGYANHMRGLVNELNKITPCKILTNLMPGFEKSVNDAELAMIKREQDYDINLIITHPLHWKSNADAKRNWVYLIWEGDKIPKWMIEECLNPNIEKIIVPSKHTKEAICNTWEEYETGNEPVDPITQKIKIVPHGYDPKIFYSQRKKDKDDGSNVSLSGDTKRRQGRTNKDEQMPVDAMHLSNLVDNHADTFKFLANKGLRNMEDRGGIQYLIKAYLEEFKETDNVELILKINPAYGVPNLLLMFPELKNPGPKIKFIPEEYTQKQLNDLYNECDVFVSPTRAEAFNLPVLEASVCKKPSITTNYGGQTDLINNENGWLINYNLVPVTHEIDYEETQWATPDINHLKYLLRYTYEHPDEVKSKGEKAYLLRNLTWENTARQIATFK